MLKPVPSNQFKKDLQLQIKRGKDREKLDELLKLLLNEDELPVRYKDHPLRGNWNGYRDAHVTPDWILIYRVEGDELQLARTGSHADLF